MRYSDPDVTVRTSSWSPPFLRDRTQAILYNLAGPSLIRVVRGREVKHKDTSISMQAHTFFVPSTISSPSLLLLLKKITVAFKEGKQNPWFSVYQQTPCSECGRLGVT